MFKPQLKDKWLLQNRSSSFIYWCDTDAVCTATFKWSQVWGIHCHWGLREYIKWCSNNRHWNEKDPSQSSKAIINLDIAIRRQVIADKNHYSYSFIISQFNYYELSFLLISLVAHHAIVYCTWMASSIVNLLPFCYAIAVLIKLCSLRWYTTYMTMCHFIVVKK